MNPLPNNPTYKRFNKHWRERGNASDKPSPKMFSTLPKNLIDTFILKGFGVR